MYVYGIGFQAMACGGLRVTGVILLLGLSAASVHFRGDLPFCRTNLPTTRAGHANISAAPVIARLRGGQANLATVDDHSRVNVRTSLKDRKFFWTSGEPAPPRKSVREQGDMVMLQGFNWKMAGDRRALYTELAAEMAPLAAAGVKTVWFPPPSESADVQGYLPGRWYVISNRTLLEAAIDAAHAVGIVPMVDVVLNHRAAIRISPNSSWWTDFEGPDWGTQFSCFTGRKLQNTDSEGAPRRMGHRQGRLEVPPRATSQGMSR